MKRLLALAVICLVFFGCKKDDDDNNNQRSSTCYWMFDLSVDSINFKAEGNQLSAYPNNHCLYRINYLNPYISLGIGNKVDSTYISGERGGFMLFGDITDTGVFECNLVHNGMSNSLNGVHFIGDYSTSIYGFTLAPETRNSYADSKLPINITSMCTASTYDGLNYNWGLPLMGNFYGNIFLYSGTDLNNNYIYDSLVNIELEFTALSYPH